MLRRLALGAILVAAAVPLQATIYTLEPDYTQGVFRWNHLGFSSPAAQFAQGQGTLEFDPTDPTKASGLGRYVPQVGDDIEMHIICQAVEAKAYAEYLKTHPK